MIKYLLYLLFISAILLTGLRYVEKRSIYFPMKHIGTTPSYIGLAYEETFFSASDGVKLCGWFIPPEKENSFILLFCHGNAGNISHRLEKILIFHRLGLGVFIFDYRGYGKSEGRPSEAGLYKDAQAAFGYLISKGTSRDDIVVYGESIGGAVAIDLATKQNFKAIITEDTFSSAMDMIHLAYPYLPYFIFSSRFDSLTKIRKVDIPKLIIHSIDDEIVPYYLGEKLYEAAPSPKEPLKLRGSHNTAFLESGEEYAAGIDRFLKELKK